MSSAIDQLLEAPGPTDPAAPAAPGAVPFEAVRTTTVHQALCWFPVHRCTGRTLTEELAAAALAHNRTIPPEPPTAVRLKIRTDGAGVRYAKCRTEGGAWELCFASLDPWLCDIVEHRTDTETFWEVTVPSAELVLRWTGEWDDHPDVTGLWLGRPWLRAAFEAGSPG